MSLDPSLITTLIQERKQHEVYPPATQADIMESEEALGVMLPKSYCSFLDRV